MPGTLNDIAESLNVSVSLVSKVLSGRLGNTTARENVVDAIRRRASEIGYVKNSAAAGLATGRQNAIGVYLHHHGAAGSGLAEAVIEGVAAEARRAGLRLVLTYFDNTTDFEKVAADISPNVVDAIIVAGVGHKDLGPHLDRIRRTSVPVVTMMDHAIHKRVPNIGVDQRVVGRIAAMHLAERGCKRIAHIRTGIQRYEGYLQGLDAAKLRPSQQIVYEARSYKFEEGVAAIEHFASRGIQFDGLVAQSDQQAIGALHTLLKMKKRVPQDVKIVGVDNSPFCGFSVVPLSSVSQQERERGPLAVMSLLGEGKKNVTVEPVLHVRASTE
jgi:LacI family transcriptional regulator